MARSLIDTDGTTTSEPQDSHDPLPTLPFRVIYFSLFALPGHANKYEHQHSIYSS
jgi:hypothetical protein